jgi:hypothetical protein
MSKRARDPQDEEEGDAKRAHCGGSSSPAPPFLLMPGELLGHMASLTCETVDEFPYETLSALARTCRQFADAVEVLARTRLALFTHVFAARIGHSVQPGPWLMKWLPRVRKVLQPDWRDNIGPSASPSSLSIIGFIGLCLGRLMSIPLSVSVSQLVRWVIYYTHSSRVDIDHTTFDYVSWYRHWPCSVVVGYHQQAVVEIIGDQGPWFALDYAGYYDTKEKVNDHMKSPNFARAPSSMIKATIGFTL